MSNRLAFDGLAELRAALRNLPAELTGEASRIVEATTNAVAVEVRSEYGKHVVTGNLQAGVVVAHVDRGKFVATGIVKSTAKHAAIFEIGTQARHTDLGANRGAMPPGNIFVPIAIRRRRAMEQALKNMIERHGLQVKAA